MALTQRLETIQKKSHLDLELGDLLYGFRTLRDHLARKTEGFTKEHERQHLMTALQGAVTLEFATLPPYLSAIWSIKDDLHPVAKSLREILQEEMLHMALACNMLVAIGGQPEINTAPPVYPGKLPLNVHPELTIPLGGFSKTAIKAFLEIERPNHPGHAISLKAAHEIHRANPGETGDFTIGELYDQILQAFRSQAPVLETYRQISGPLAWRLLKDLDDVQWAIETIQHQGEGSEGPPDTGADDLAHYYRFAEMFELKRLEFNEETQEFEFTTPIDFDMEQDVWPMAQIPVGGYTDDKVPDPEVRRLLRGFNETYSRLLDLLQAAWRNDDGQAMFWHAIETMFALQKYSKPLIQTPLPDGSGNYGPDFRYIPVAERGRA